MRKKPLIQMDSEKMHRYLLHKIVRQVRQVIIRRKHNKAYQLHKKADSLIGENNYEFALVLINDAIGLHPDYSMLYAARCDIKTHFGDYTGAEKDERKFLELLKEEDPEFYKQITNGATLPNE